MAATGTDPRPERGVSAQTAKSGAWLYARNIVTGFVNIAAMAVLARQLDPSDFALVVLSQVILRFLSILGDAGVAEYVIYDRAEGREGRVHAAFWLNFVLTGVTVSAGFALVSLISGFYRQPLLAPIMMLALISYAITQLAVIPDALLKRALDYRKLVARDTFLEVTAAIFSVLMALWGFGVWSLVIPAAVLAPIRVISVLYLARWRPRLPLRIREWRPIARFTFSALGANFTSSLTAEGDTLLIGKTLGPHVLGIYNLAWQTSNFVSRNITNVLGKLAMPALSAVAADAERLRSAYGRMVRVLAIVSFPFLVGIFVLAEEFVLTLYGPNWSGAVLPLRIFLIYALRHVIGGPPGVIPQVVGRPEILLQFCMGIVPFYLLSLWVGSHFGFLGIAVAVTVVRTLGGIVSFWIAARLLGAGPFDWVRQVAPPFAASCLMGAVVAGGKAVMVPLGLPSGVILLALIVVGAAAYLLILRVAYRPLLMEIVKVADSLSVGLGRLMRRLAGLSPVQV